jgi:hypothetical protein
MPAASEFDLRQRVQVEFPAGNGSQRRAAHALQVPAGVVIGVEISAREEGFDVVLRSESGLLVRRFLLMWRGLHGVDVFAPRQKPSR